MSVNRPRRLVRTLPIGRMLTQPVELKNHPFALNSSMEYTPAQGSAFGGRRERNHRKDLFQKTALEVDTPLSALPGLSDRQTGRENLHLRRQLVGLLAWRSLDPNFKPLALRVS